MTTHAIAKLYHYTKHLDLRCNAIHAASVKMILGAVIPTSMEPWRGRMVTSAE